jgi:hypothetical protein
MPTLTNIQGSVFNASGSIVSTGKLYITLQQDIISVDGTKVVPSTVTVDLVATSGVINVNLYATIGATPSGIYYFVEYDPTPTDLTVPRKQKDGLLAKLLGRAKHWLSCLSRFLRSHTSSVTHGHANTYLRLHL